MKYTLEMTAYEMAMLDAACRACGLPLVSALVVTANRRTAEGVQEAESSRPVEDAAPEAESADTPSDTEKLS